MTGLAVRPPLVMEKGAPTEDVGLLQGAPSTDPVMHATLAALYGPSFPPLTQTDTPEAWAAWVRDRWDHHAPGVRSRLHLVDRNRRFREGDQWIDSRGGQAWSEPKKPRDAARIVINMIGPALDLRVQIVSEQRPGFRVKPATQDPEDLKKADAQTLALEYQYDAQKMLQKIKELAFWCGTDGACFLELFWNPDKGPWHEAFAEVDGQQIPLGPDGQPAETPHRFPLGDLDCRIRRIEQVRVSAEATGCYAPWYWLIKDVMPHAQAVREYGPKAAQVGQGHVSEGTDRLEPTLMAGYIHPDQNELLRDQDTVDRYTMYCERSEYLPGGLHLIVIGDTLVRGPSPLLVGLPPMVRFTDGSTDPAFYPRPEMEKWIPSQQGANATISKWVESVRLMAGPKFYGKEGSIVGESLIGGVGTFIGVKTGLEDLNSVIRTLESTGVGTDAKELLQIFIKQFQDMSGWNDVTRGSFSAEQSGRAILAIRAQLERLFAPMVASFAGGMSEWGRVSLAFMKWGYDLPRTLGVEGKNRPDLARALQSDDFDGAADVFIDPDTMMPLPREAKQQHLDQLFQMQLISGRDYLRRSAYTNIRFLGTPDDDQEAVARRIVEQIRQTAQPPQPAPWMWTYNEALHQDIVERELLFAADVPPEIQVAAWMWWQLLAQQAAMKQGMVPMGAPPQAGGPKGPQQQAKPDGQQQRQSPALQQPESGVVTDPQQAARTFEQTAPR